MTRFVGLWLGYLPSHWTSWREHGEYFASLAEAEEEVNRRYYNGSARTRRVTWADDGTPIVAPTVEGSWTPGVSEHQELFLLPLPRANLYALEAMGVAHATHLSVRRRNGRWRLITLDQYRREEAAESVTD